VVVLEVGEAGVGRGDRGVAAASGPGAEGAGAGRGEDRRAPTEEGRAAAQLLQYPSPICRVTFWSAPKKIRGVATNHFCSSGRLCPASITPGHGAPSINDLVPFKENIAGTGSHE
jgi:hypothetical protein